MRKTHWLRLAVLLLSTGGMAQTSAPWTWEQVRERFEQNNPAGVHQSGQVWRLSIEDAAVEGAVLRLRPIMMTMLVATLGLLPAALSHAIGSDSQRPFAIVMVGGLIAALVMSIFLLPTLYVWVAGDRDVLPPAEEGFELGVHVDWGTETERPAHFRVHGPPGGLFGIDQEVVTLRGLYGELRVPARPECRADAILTHR